MNEGRAEDGHLILISAPFGRDAKAIGELLALEGYAAQAYSSLKLLAHAINENVGAVILTEEALGSGQPELQQALERQDAWSDIPLILLAASNNGSRRASDLARLRLPELST